MVDSHRDRESEKHVPDEPEDGSNGRVQPDPFAQIVGHLAELKAYAAHFAHAQMDSARVSIRNGVILAVAGAIGLIVLIGIAVTSVVFVFIGLGEGLPAAFGVRPWLGNLLAGMTGVIFIGGGLTILAVRSRAAFRRSLVEKYEQQKEQQHERFGRDVDKAGRDAL